MLNLRKCLPYIPVVISVLCTPYTSFANESNTNCRLHVMMRAPTKNNSHVQNSYFQFLDSLVAKGYDPIAYTDDRQPMGKAGDLRLKIDQKIGRGVSCTAHVEIEERLADGAIYDTNSDAFRVIASATGKKKSLWKAYCADAVKKATDLLPACRDLQR